LTCLKNAKVLQRLGASNYPNDPYVRFLFKELFSIVNIMDSHSINQLAKFKKLMMLYGHYERIGNVCVFRTKGKATCVNIDQKYL